MIWARVLELAGESESGTSQCPGTGCSRWENAAGSYEDKVKATLGCEKCEGRPPAAEFEVESSKLKVEESDEVAELVEEIEDIIEWEDAGHVTDWSCYGFAHARLATVWRKAERYVERRQHGRMQSFLVSWMKSGGGE